MYYLHEAFATPDKETIVWHYFSLAKFLSLLNDKQLFFQRSDLFFDSKEGKLSNKDKQLYNYYNASSLVGRSESGGLGCCYVNCWVMSDVELYLMWSTYSSLNEGIAVKSTVGNLIKALDPNEKKEVIISDVKYIDYDTDYTFDKAGGIANAIAPYFCKRQYFSQEKELRLVHYDPYMRFRHEVYNMKFDVSLGLLIDEVWIAPNAEDWYVNLIKKELDLHGIEKPIIQSGMKRNKNE